MASKHLAPHVIIQGSLCPRRSTSQQVYSVPTTHTGLVSFFHPFSLSLSLSLFFSFSVGVSTHALFRQSKKDLEYSIEDDGRGEYFFVVANGNGCKNFVLMRTPVNATTVDNWKVFLPYDPNRYVRWVRPFKNFIVLGIREGGFTRILVSSSHEEARFGELRLFFSV